MNKLNILIIGAIVLAIAVGTIAPATAQTFQQELTQLNLVNWTGYKI